jgi:hypothetical protein
VKIRAVTYNNRRKAFLVRTWSRSLTFAYSSADPEPDADDPVRDVFVDPELGREAFTYVLRSGRRGTIHVEQALEADHDPGYLRRLLLYRLTVEAQARVGASRVSRREIIARLGTSASQFYRLLDQTNYGKSIDQLLSLFHVLDCDVDITIRPHRSGAENGTVTFVDTVRTVGRTRSVPKARSA